MQAVEKVILRLIASTVYCVTETAAVRGLLCQPIPIEFYK